MMRVGAARLDAHAAQRDWCQRIGSRRTARRCRLEVGGTGGGVQGCERAHTHLGSHRAVLLDQAVHVVRLQPARRAAGCADRRRKRRRQARRQRAAQRGHQLLLLGRHQGRLSRLLQQRMQGTKLLLLALLLQQRRHLRLLLQLLRGKAAQGGWLQHKRLQGRRQRLQRGQWWRVGQQRVCRVCRWRRQQARRKGCRRMLRWRSKRRPDAVR